MTGSGIAAVPAGTLAGRAIARLAISPCDSLVLAREVLGLGAASPAVADRVAAALLGADPRVRRLGDGRWCVSGWTSASGGPPANALAQASFAVVDVETTGTSPRHGDRVIEIAVVGLDSTGLRLLYHSLLNPGLAIPRWVGTLTGITNEMLRDCPRFADIADELMAVLAGRVFVAHNARFDWAFVSSELRIARDLRLDGPRLCTVRLAKRLVPGLKSRGLDSLVRYFGIEIRQRHRAEGDASATAAVLKRLISLALEQGFTTIADLEALGRGSGRRRRRRPSALPRPITEI